MDTDNRRVFLWLRMPLAGLWLLLGAPVFGATYYVDGSRAADSGDGRSWATAKKYINSGVLLMSGGDTLIVRSGTYTSDNDRIKNPPSGSAGNYTTIKADVDFGAVLQGLSVGTAPGNNEAVINLYQKSYVAVEGFIIKDVRGTSPYALSAVEITGSRYCKLRKVGVKNGTPPTAEYGGAVGLEDSSYCLLEDVFACGMMRYGIALSGGDNAPASNHNILRRCVVRWDYCTTAEPRAAIVVYGGYTGTPPSAYTLLQNCIVIDGNQGDPMFGTFVGGFTVPHETSYVQRYGCISLNNRGYGFHSAEDRLSHDNTNTHCVVWDCDSGFWWRHLASGVSGAYYCTVEDAAIEGPQDPGRGTVYDCVASKNVLVNGRIANMTLDGATNVTAKAGDFTYLVRSPFPDRGATIEKKMGTDGSLYGEAGYNTLSNDNLWPWPYEDTIRALFREKNDPPTGLSPGSNNTLRGFCADNTTLTKYVWEYLGHALPAVTSTTTTPTATVTVLNPPTGLTAASAVPGAVALNWQDNSNDEAGFRVERRAEQGAYAEIAAVGANVTAYTDQNLAPGAQYYYRVRGYKGTELTPYTNESSVVVTGDAAVQNSLGMNEVRVVGTAEGRGSVNPDRGEAARIYFRGSGTGKFECRIFTFGGELVWQDAKEDVSEGVFVWLPRGIASGGYVAHVTGPGINTRKKIVVLR